MSAIPITSRALLGVLVVLVAGSTTGLGELSAADAAYMVGCSTQELVNAINAANANAGADTLELSAGCTYELSAVNNRDETFGPNGLPVITSDITLHGNGATIMRDPNAPAFRFFRIEKGAALALDALFLSRGQAGEENRQGGGIYNQGTLMLANCTITMDSAMYAGGGIYNNSGTVTISHSLFSDNGTLSTDIMTVQGAAIYSSSGALLVNESEFSGNVAWYDGGAIYSQGSLDVANTSFVGNSTVLQQGTGGGAIYAEGSTAISNSTFDGNTTPLYGGALYVGGTATVSNSAFIGNRAYGAHGAGGGGAIHGNADVINSTFYGNYAGSHAVGAAIDGGGTIVSSTFSSNKSDSYSGNLSGINGATLKNTIVHDTLCFGVTDGGGNLRSPKSNTSCGGKAGDPKLGSLQDNGGSTLTMALGVHSAALDAAIDADCPSTDQRGIARPQGAHCDIGAFELELSTIQQDDSSVTYDRWRGVSIGINSLRMSNHKGDTVTFSFKGRSVQWKTWRGPDYGIAQVLIDDQDKGTFDLYSEFPPLDPDRTFEFDKLGKGKHKLAIRVLGEKNAAATDSNVALDKFVVGGKEIQETARRIFYNEWRGYKEAQASGGTYRANENAKAKVGITFTGPGIQWLTAKGPTLGKAKVFIDGVQRGGVFDLYALTPTGKSQFHLAA